MYSCVYVDSDDPERNFWFGLKCGVIFDMDPLGEVDVDIDTESAYRQIGEVINSYSVGGVSRDLEGTILDMHINGVTAATINPNQYIANEDEDLSSDNPAYNGAYGTAKRMLYVFSPGRAGKLYFFEDEDDMSINNGAYEEWDDDNLPGENPSYYAAVTVERTPKIHYDEKTRKFTFELSLYSVYPYWISCKPQEFVTSFGDYSYEVEETSESGFTFPDSYTSHHYGVITTSYTESMDTSADFTLDASSVAIPIDVTFECVVGSEVPYIVLQDETNNRLLVTRQALDLGDTLHIYWNDEGELTVDYYDYSTGEMTSDLAYIYLYSDLLYLEGGENKYSLSLLNSVAADGEYLIRMTIAYAERSAGVCAKGKTYTVSRI